MNTNDLAAVLQRRDQANRRRQSKRALLVVFILIPVAVLGFIGATMGIGYLLQQAGAI